MQPDPILCQKIVHGPAPEALALLEDLLARHDDASQLGQLVVDLFSRQRFDLAAMIFSAWTRKDPGNPEPWSNLGLCFVRLGRSSDARNALEHAVSLDRSYAAARNNLCSVYQRLGMHELQLESALVAVDLQPDSAVALNNLGSAYLELGRSSEAKQAFRSASARSPENFETQFNLARVAYDEGKFSEATRFLETALAGPFGAVAHYREMLEYHLAYAKLSTGQLKEGWRLYERGFASNVSPAIARRPVRSFGVPRWDGRPLARGERLLVWREQGIGDELRFLSLLPRLGLGEGELIIETEPRLVRMLCHAFPEAEVREQQLDEPTARDFSVEMPVGSLPSLLLAERSDFGHGKYLVAEETERQRFASRLASYGDRPKIGICWRSHQLGGARHKKYVSLEDWQELLSLPDAVFVSLQYGEAEDELREIEASLGVEIIRWPDVDLKNDLEAVLGLMHQLDLVVSTSTAVVPMAGALGVPTLLMTQPTWMMLGQTECYPWFSSVQPFIAPCGQPVSTCLPAVVAAVRDRLRRGRS